MYRSIWIAAIVALAAGLVTPASAQVVCGDRAKMIGYLGDGFKEARSGIGLGANGAVVELYTAENGSWTLLMTAPGGPTCVIGNGEGWEGQPTQANAPGEVS